MADQNDFLIKFGTNLSSTMKDIENAIAIARQLDSVLNTANRTAQTLKQNAGVATAGSSSTSSHGSSFTDPRVISSLNQIQANTRGMVTLLGQIVKSYGTFGTTRMLTGTDPGQPGVRRNQTSNTEISSAVQSALVRERQTMRVQAAQDAERRKPLVITAAGTRHQDIGSGSGGQSVFSLSAIQAAQRQMEMDVNSDAARRFGMRKSVERQTQPKAGGTDIIETAFRRALVWGAVSTVIFKAVDAAQTFLNIMIDMDKQIADLRKTVNGTDQDFQKLVDSSINVARTYKVGTKEVLDAIEIFSKQFKDAGDLETLAQSAALFSNLSGQSIQKSAETITSTIQQYNLTVAESTHITDSWANVAANSAVTIQDLGDAVGVVGQVAETAGVKFDMLNAMVATVSASTGKSGTEIGNAFKRIFERATTPENARVIEGAGIKLLSGESGKEGQLRNFTNVLEDVHGKWDKMTDSQRKNLAVAFAGARQYDSFIALMTNWNEVTRLTDTSLNSFGAAQRQNERIADTFVKKIQALKNEFDALARGVGTVMLPFLGGLLVGFTSLVKVLNTVPGAIHAITIAMAALAASGIGKFLFNQFGSSIGAGGGRIAKSGGLGRALTPFIVEAGTANASFSLSQGIRTLGASTVASGGISGGIAGAAGGAARGLGFGASVATLISGIATLATAFGALYIAVKSAAFIFDLFKFKGKEFTDTTTAQATTQFIEADKLRKQSLSINRLGGDIKKEGLTPETLGAVGSIVSSLQKDDRFKDFFSQNAIPLDFENRAMFGDAGDAQQKLAALGAEIKKFAREDVAEAMSILFTKGVSTKQNFMQFLSGGKEGLGVGTQSVGQEFLQNILENSSLKAIGQIQGAPGLKEIFGIGRSSRTAGEFGTNLKGAVEKGAGRELKPAEFSAFVDGDINSLFEIIKAARDTKAKFAEVFERARTLRAESLKETGVVKEGKRVALTDAEAFALATKEMNDFINMQRGPSGGANVAPGLGEELFAPLRDPRTGKYDPGAFGAGKGKIKEFVKSPVTRIDLELQKSLIDTGTNYKNLGSEIDVAGEAVNAYRKAITDLGIEINKSAGPKEEEAAFKRQERIFDLKEKKKAMEKAQNAAGASQVAEQIFQEENIAQAIVKQTEERRKLNKVLQEQFQRLKDIAVQSNVLKSAIAGTITGAPANLRERKLGGDQLNADIDFANQRLNRVLAGGQETAAKRNEAKHIREEIQAMNREMDALNKKTDLWNNLLTKIGDGIMSSLADRISKGLVDSFVIPGVESSTDQIKAGTFQQSSTFDPTTGAIAIGAVGAGAIGAGSMMSNPTGKDQLGRTAQPSLNGAGSNIFANANQSNQNLAAGANEKSTMKAVGAYLAGALAGAGVGSTITQARGKEGQGGAIGGAIGGAVGTYFSAYGGSIWGPALGGFIGSLFDKDVEPLKKTMDELEEVEKEVVYQLQSLEKKLNTVNDTMQNIINAPSNFVLPIPKGILEGSVSAQSAIATPLQAGGLVIKSGPAYLHAGDRIPGVGSNGGGSTMIENHFEINGGGQDPQAIADAVMDKMNSSLFYQSQRAGSYPGRV